MKTLNQEELFLVSGGNDEAEEVVSVEVPVEVEVEAPVEVVVAEPTFLQVTGSFLSKLALGCCS